MKGAFTGASSRADGRRGRGTRPSTPSHTQSGQGEPWRHGVHGSESKHRRPTEIKTARNPRNLLRHNKRSFRPTPDNSERQRRIAYSPA